MVNINLERENKQQITILRLLNTLALRLPSTLASQNLENIRKCCDRPPCSVSPFACSYFVTLAAVPTLHRII